MNEEGAPISHLTNDTINDILLRLPAKSVLCAGAVCKAWRHITTTNSFVAEHARLQPTNVVLYTYVVRPGLYEDELALDLLPVSSSDESRRRLMRYPKDIAQRRLLRYPKDVAFLLIASYNGVLLFQKSLGTYLLCNPTTGKWADLSRVPLLPDPVRVIMDEYAFYYHEPSSEYRLLLRHRQRHRSWFILSTGAAEPREVGLHAWLAEDMGISTLLRTTLVALEGRLHWPPRQAGDAPVDAAFASGGSEAGTTKMVVFDTLSETFHLMAGPPTATANRTKAFDMEGRLVVADFGDDEHVDLWFLEDYNAGRWERRHRVPTPPWHAHMPEPAERRPWSMVAAGDDRQGDVILANRRGLLVYNLRTRTARTVDFVAALEHNVGVSRHVFRESLVQHPSFAVRSAAELGVNISWH